MKIIQNEKEIATNVNRQKVLKIIKAGLKKVCPHTLIKDHLMYNPHFNSVIVQGHNYDLLKGRIFVIGGGKAAGFMAEALEEVIGVDNITAGIVTCTTDKYKTEKVKVVRAGHPLPDRRGEKAVVEMLKFKHEYGIGEKDLVLCLISGGGSAMLPYPAEGISLKEKREVTLTLIESGASIYEINVVRKHLSQIKGGGLAAHFQPAQVVGLMISDVASGSLETIASGLTVMDPTTFADAQMVIDKYHLTHHLPLRVATYIARGANGNIPETPKRLKRCDNYIIGNNATALEAMSLEAKSLGFKPLIVAANLSGDPVFMARAMAKEIIAGEFKNYEVILIGGETSPALPSKHGKGGRNMHFVAASLEALKNLPGEWVVASINTDGEDYLTDYAGALVDQHTYNICLNNKLEPSEYLEKFDTFRMFKKINDSLIKTGPTGTNVGDTVVYLLPQ